ncbi:Sensor histidine kinase DesK [compost metagenome]
MNESSLNDSRLFKAVPVLFLLYLGSPVSGLLQKPASISVIGLCLIAVFIFCYLHGFWSDRYRFQFTLVLLAIVGYISWVAGPMSLLLGFYPSALMGLLKRRREFRMALAAMLVLLAGVSVLQGGSLRSGDWLTLVPPVLLMLFIPMVMRIVRASRELKTQLHTAHEEIARLSKIEERQRISRDLHDTLGHTLSLITLKSELAEKLLSAKPERAAAEIQDIQKTSRAALKQVRDLVSGMNAMNLEDELVQARSILLTAGVRMVQEGASTFPEASPLVQNMLGLCLREGVNNVVKHSLARVCTIMLHDSPGEYMMRIEDDGRGGTAPRPDVMSSGRGLLGMKDRLELIQGRMEFRHEPGSGAALTIHIPKIRKE